MMLTVLRSSPVLKRPATQVARRWCGSRSRSEGEEVREMPLFDTYDVVVELRKSGVGEKEAKTIMKVMDRVIANTVSKVRAEYVPKQTYNGELQRQWSELDQMRRNILVLEKTEMFSLRRDIEKLVRQIEAVGSTTESQLNKVEHGVKLDQSLIKSHVNAELQKITETVDTRVQTELSKVEHHFANSIHREIAQAKLDAYRNIVALVIAIATVLMTYLRFFPLTTSPVPVQQPVAIVAAGQQPAQPQTPVGSGGNGGASQ